MTKCNKTFLSQIKSILYPNLVIFIIETFVEFVIFFYLQPQLLRIHLSPANLTIAIHFTLASNKSQPTSMLSKFISMCHYKYFKNINTSHQHSKNYTGFLSNKESITKSVFSHTKHISTFNNLHSTYLYNSLLFPSHSVSTRSSDSLVLSIPYVRSSLGKRASSVIGPRLWIHSLLIPETHLLYQYSIPGSKHTFTKLRSLPRLFPISLDCLPRFWFLLFSFYALSIDILLLLLLGDVLLVWQRRSCVVVELPINL